MFARSIKSLLGAVGLFLLVALEVAHAQAASPNLVCPDGYGVISTSGQPSCGTFANTEGVLPVYDTTGNLKLPSHAVVGNCTLSLGTCTVTLTGSAAFTTSSTYFCSASDQSLTAAAAAWITNTSATQFAVFGVLSHVINFNCFGW